MALPTGSGSEIIKATHFNSAGANNAGTTTLITGVALHIYTVISIIFTNMTTRTNDTLNLGIYGYDSKGSTNNEDHYLLNSQAIGSKETFVWDNKFSFHGQGSNSGVQKLQFYTAGDNASAFDINITYIDQDWT